MALGESRIGGESGNGGESAIVAHVSDARRKVIIVWLRQAGYEGDADDLSHAGAGSAAQIAYDIAEHIEEAVGDDEMAQLVWHLRDWADQHEKLKRTCVCSCARCGPMNAHDCGRAACNLRERKRDGSVP